MSISVKNFRCPVRNHHIVFEAYSGREASIPMGSRNLSYTAPVSTELRAMWSKAKDERSGSETAQVIGIGRSLGR
jgi:hypothetical protein